MPTHETEDRTPLEHILVFGAISDVVRPLHALVEAASANTAIGSTDRAADVVRFAARGLRDLDAFEDGRGFADRIASAKMTDAVSAITAIQALAFVLRGWETRGFEIIGGTNAEDPPDFDGCLGAMLGLSGPLAVEYDWSRYAEWEEVVMDRAAEGEGVDDA